ncbi:transcription termination/antitermination protein NusG [endosymbiont GvMRE of Glomus versiforme]|uniref:transcription termination/antitermination protein NusG n=1 Tax=endosymbiont GvMRE of Glomus versiforme TaxID=2039283 RepID=UPI001558BF4B|nr:transcription termination/antitermination NusG family protein [endosymbiont GvMRE of Glomus versiforme]
MRSGKEREVIVKIKNELEKTNIQEKVADLRFIPQSTKEKSLLPGYIFCHCVLDEELIQVVHTIPGVKILPEPLSPQKASEFLTLLQKAEKGEIGQKETGNFKRGELIKVIRGVYEGCQGEITEIEPEGGDLITINVNFLGRLSPVKVLVTDCLRVKKS